MMYNDYGLPYVYYVLWVMHFWMFLIGAEPSIFKSKFVCLRLHYQHYAEDGFFHTFRIPRTRLFNNMIIAVKNMEDAKGRSDSSSTWFIFKGWIHSV